MPFGEEARQDRAAVLPLVMDDRQRLGVDDQVMMHAFQAEVAGEFADGIDPPRGRRKHLNDDDRVGHFERIGGQFRSAIDERIRFVRGPLADPYRHAIGKHMARQSCLVDGFEEGSVDSKFHLRVSRPFRRHRIDPSPEQLMAALLAFCPSKEFVNRHWRCIGRFACFAHTPKVPLQQREAKRWRTLGNPRTCSPRAIASWRAASQRLRLAHG